MEKVAYVFYVYQQYIERNKFNDTQVDIVYLFRNAKALKTKICRVICQTFLHPCIGTTSGGTVYLVL